MSVKQQLVTAEELYEMPEVPGKSRELVDGEVVEVSPVKLRHGLITGLVYDALKHHVRQHNLGLVIGDNFGYVLKRDPDTMRVPDVSFLARDRAPDLDRFGEGPPTIAVEVISPTDRASDIQERVRDYLQAGTLQVWILWPRSRSMSVYRPDADTLELGSEGYLDGGDALPGFSVRVGDLFDVE